MKKCKSCGKMHDDDYIEICDNCGFDFEEHKQVQKKLGEKEHVVINQQPSDLVDYPILSFILGLLSMVLPIFILSFVAIHLAKKPCKPSLEPFVNLGKIFGMLGLMVSTILFGYLIYTFIIN